MAIKFSQFVLKTLPSELDFIVGYKGTENLQITPDNFLAPYLGAYLPLAGGTMTGTTNHGDNVYSQWGTGTDFWMVHDGANTYFQNETGDLVITNNANNKDIQFKSDDGAGGATLYYYLDGSVERNRFPKNVYLEDNVKLLFGDATTPDLEIYHDGSNSYIQDTGTGNLLITSDGASVQINKGLTENMAEFIVDGAVNLYYDSARKFETVADGVNLPDNNALFLDNTNNNNPVYFRNAGTNAATLQIGRGTTPGSNLSMEISTGGDTTFAGNVTAATVLNINRTSGSTDDRLTITSADIVTTIERVENTGDGLAGYGRIDFKTNATIGGTAGRGGFKFINGSGNDILYLENNDSSATFAGNVVLGTGDNLYLNGTTGLRILHDGANALFINQTAGDIKIQNSVSDKDIIFKGVDGVSSIDALTLDMSDAGNATFSGNVSLVDNKYLYLGTSNDLQLYHDGTDSYVSNTQNSGDLIIQNGANDKDVVFKCDDGSGGTRTYLYLDGSQAAAGDACWTIWPDNSRIGIGDSKDMQMHHEAGNNYITQTVGDLYINNTANDKDIIFQSDDGAGAITEYFRVDGGATKVIASKNFAFLDDVYAEFGDSGDLQIHHDGANSFIKETGTGNFYLRASDSLYIQRTSDGLEMAQFTGGGGSFLYYNGNLKFGTSSTGTTTTGQMNIAALNTAPPSASAAGTLGEIRYTADYIYVCTATNTWKRSALSTW